MGQTVNHQAVTRRTGAQYLRGTYCASEWMPWWVLQAVISGIFSSPLRLLCHSVLEERLTERC
jgi:hypothetical protein